MRFLIALLLCASQAMAEPSLWRREWPQTDFQKTTVPDWSEIMSGGPPKDGIPAVDNPRHTPVSQANLPGQEPVVVVALGSSARAYPLRYLMWHEIANDTLGGVPITVTFCPLCNTAIVFDRRSPAGVLDFGVSGKLRKSDMVMYDRQTESWWQQATGTAIVGALTGTELKTLPVWLDSWERFAATHPNGTVIAEPDAARAYGRNPYAGYDTSARPFLYTGENPPHGINPLARVVRVGNHAWPLTRLRAAGRIEEAGVVLTWEAGQASALDSGAIAQGRDVGNVRVRTPQGKDVVHDIPFAFAFHAFHPDGVWMLR